MAANSTFIQLPMDVTNPLELRRFLDKLVEQLDVAFGNRGDGAFAQEVSVDTVEDILNNLDSRITVIENVLPGMLFDIQQLEFGVTVTTTQIDTVVGIDSVTILCDCVNNNIIITLPTAADVFTSGKSKTISISKIDITNNIVSIVPKGSELILGESSLELLESNEIINLITDGNNWYLGA